MASHLNQRRPGGGGADRGVGHHGRVLILREVPRSGVHVSAGMAAAETTTALGLAHTAAGGAAPSPGWLLAAAAIAYGASLVVLRGRAPVRVVAPVFVVLQIVLHAWLVALTAGTEVHAHAGGTEAAFGLSWPMLLAHAGAGMVAAAAWVLRGRAVDVLLGWRDQPTPGIPHRTRTRADRGFRVAPAGRDVSVLPTRGPPPQLFAAA